MTDAASLEVRRVIAATPARLFEMWTTPAQLLLWFGPRGVRCTAADLDLRVGGRYRIASELPDGRTVVIAGEFLSIERPHALVYTWSIEPHAGAPERVTVRFDPPPSGTEVVVRHERIPDAPTRASHETGWLGCLDRLDELCMMSNG
jgi:uncharacterized protein YndB with AHSA1/START domain